MVTVAGARGPVISLGLVTANFASHVEHHAAAHTANGKKEKPRPR